MEQRRSTILSEEGHSRRALLAAFWPSGLVCPACGSRPTKHTASLLKCVRCSRAFSERTGTPFARLRGETRTLLQAFLMIQDRRRTGAISEALALSPTTVRALRRGVRAAIRNGHAQAISRLESFLRTGTDESPLSSLATDGRVRECLEVLGDDPRRDAHCGRCGGPLSRKGRARLRKVCRSCGRPWSTLVGTPIYNAKSGACIAVCASILARDGWPATAIGRALGVSRQTAARFRRLTGRWQASSNELDEVMEQAEKNSLLSALRRMASVASLGYDVDVAPRRLP